MGHLYKHDKNSVSLKNIIDDFTVNFDGNTFYFDTNIKGYEKIYVNFSIKNIDHALGFDKLQERPAKDFDKLLALIRSNSYNYDNLKQDKAYKDIRDRFEHYYFINNVFYPENDDHNQFMISVRGDIRRLGRVELVIYEPINNRRNVIIGLIPISNKSNHFAIATLHVRTNNTFFNVYRAKVTAKGWL